MKLRTMMAGMAASALLIGSASAAFAYGPHGYGHGYGCGWGGAAGYQAMPPENREAAESLMKEHWAAVEPLRQQLEARQLELDALSRNPNTKPETLTKLSEEVARLSAELRQKNVELRSKMSEVTGMPSAPAGRGGYGPGYGHHSMRGWHH